MKIAVSAVSGKLGGETAQALKTLVGVESVVGLARTPEKPGRFTTVEND